MKLIEKLRNFFKGVLQPMEIDPLEEEKFSDVADAYVAVKAEEKPAPVEEICCGKMPGCDKPCSKPCEPPIVPVSDNSLDIGETCVKAEKPKRKPRKKAKKK